MHPTLPTRLRRRPARSVVVAAGVGALLMAGPLASTTLPTATAAEKAARPATTASLLADQALSVDLAAPATALVRGDAFTVRGTVHRVASSGLSGAARRTGAEAEGVAGRFTLAVTDASGRVLARQAVRAAEDGTFSTEVPGAVTAALPGSGDATSLAVRALDATYGTSTTADAGAVPVTVRASARGLRLTNSFVSARGWVKPGERFPSRVIVTNPTSRTISNAAVTVRAAKGATFKSVAGPGTKKRSATTISWKPGRIAAGRTATLVVESQAASTRQLPTIVWRDLSSRATLTATSTKASSAAHGPKVIPPAEAYDTARYGDRPFPVVPVQYLDRTYTADHSGSSLESVLNSRSNKGSTFNLYQEMSLGQLYPDGTVPSAGIATAGFDYQPGFPFYTTDATSLNTCTGTTLADLGDSALGTPLYPSRITDGVYNLPGTLQYYGADSNGSAITGSLAGIAALQNIDSGCGDTGKIVRDAAALADPEIDYSDYDTDKDGVVDFFMAVFAGCGGNGESQGLGLDPADAGDQVTKCGLPNDNIWPHSSSLEYSMTDPVTGLAGFTTDDQLKDLEGRPLYWTDGTYKKKTTRKTSRKVFVRVGPYNLNPETAIDHASVISHEYGHSLGLPDFYSTGSRETYGDWNLMATDKSQNMDAFSRQELGWVVPKVLPRGATTTAKAMTDSKQDTDTITWRTPSGKAYTLTEGRDGRVQNSLMYVAKLKGRQLLAPSKFDTGDKATKSHAWFSGSGNDFGCANSGAGRNLDLSIPALSKLPAGSTVSLTFKSAFDTEWDFDYGFVLTSGDGGKTFTSHASQRETPTTTPASQNPNSNACQATYGNGITGSSASYTDPLTVLSDRTLANSPESVFVKDTFDVSDLAGAKTPVLRFSYSTDPGVSRPGWFIDDVQVTATTPSGSKVLLKTDFEKSGGPDDPRVFNGGCKADNPGGACTKGWNYVRAGAEADFDHAYYLEMRDRSGFDLDGHGEADRGTVNWTPGLYLAYTDEAHGYGNAGTDDPPAQSPIDSRPEPGSDTPDLSDAAFTAATGRNAFSDVTTWTDNYHDPSTASGNWEFHYKCLSLKVLSMSGQGLGPSRSDGDLTGTVRFTTGRGCGAMDYGY